MNVMEHHFTIKSENTDKTLEAIKHLCEQEKELGGGYSSLRGNTFCYVDTKEVLLAQDLKQAFSVWRWGISLDDKGDVDSISFEGENLGDDTIFFSEIAPYVEEGSYVQMHGEDGDIWRWVFRNGMCQNLSAELSFPED